MVDVWKYDGKNVKLQTKDGRKYEGVCTAGTDYETNMDFLDFDMPDNTIHEVDADEIISIDEID